MANVKLDIEKQIQHGERERYVSQLLRFFHTCLTLVTVGGLFVYGNGTYI